MPANASQGPIHQAEPRGVSCRRGYLQRSSHESCRYFPPRHNTVLHFALLLKMTSKLCDTCQSIVQGEQKLREDQLHHTSVDGLLTAANEGCCICRKIVKSPAWRDLPPTARATFAATWYLVPLTGPFAGWFKLSIEGVTTMEDEDPHMSEDDGEESFDMPDSPIWGFFLQPAKGKLTSNVLTSIRISSDLSCDNSSHRTLSRCSVRPASQFSRPRDVQSGQPLVLRLLE